MRGRLKRLARTVLGRAGLTVARTDPSLSSDQRLPVGDTRAFFEGLAARGFAPASVLDVGAHRGDWSRTARAVFPGARFVLVEPQREWARDLERFCAESADAATGATEWIAAAAGAEAGERMLAIDPAGGGSSLLPGAAGAAAMGAEARAVPVVTLDSIYAGGARPLPDLVKIDVEGMELEVLSGASTLLGTAELFVVEAALFRYRPEQATFAELVAWMAGRGYLPYDFPWFLRRPLDGALGLCDVAFARAAGPLRASARWE
jgi:FkbM family methyltransferase